ncbi:MAG: tRNA dihydrouridine synthase DusB [Fimbriimonadaceae bacterium]|nr:tRNA dihydrouridine synthase DusB [Fimbriimonadaceae bacterium]
MAPAFHVGDIPIQNRLILAPMEDVSNLPFRLIAKRVGNPGLMFTEFVSAMAIHYNAKKTFRKLKIHPDERPLGIQIFGGVPEIMAETAQLCEAHGADIIDINMGCWVPKVCKTGSGAALLKDPELAEKIVEAVVKSVKVPVTVKVRAGWDFSLYAAPELAKRFVGVGAKMITLHARFAKQGFEGEADWRLISEMRKAVDVPLIGNGDVKTPEDAVRLLSETGADGVMVGRAAISNPWTLARIQAGLAGEEIPPMPTIRERIDTAIEHLKLMVAYQAEVDSWEEALALPKAQFDESEMYATRHLRGQVPMYIKGEVGAAETRNRLTQCNRVDEVRTVLEEFAAGLALTG